MQAVSARASEVSYIPIPIRIPVKEGERGPPRATVPRACYSRLFLKAARSTAARGSKAKTEPLPLPAPVPPLEDHRAPPHLAAQEREMTCPHHAID